MTLPSRNEEEFKRSINIQLKNASSPLEKLRLKCLARGIDGIRALGRTFTRVLDRDGDRKLSFTEFQNGLNNYGLHLSSQELRSLFDLFDDDRSGSLDFNEFLEHLRPPMSDRRKAIIERAFCKLDTTGDGKLTTADLEQGYNVKQHPKYQNGEWSQKRCLEEFLNTFDGKNPDGVVTKEEFFNYYSGVSASIDQDPYFDLMMRNAYDLRD